MAVQNRITMSESSSNNRRLVEGGGGDEGLCAMAIGSALEGTARRQ
jgi:hypothetical protein